MKNIKGFTVIELFITIAIAGILFGYGTPSFYRLKQKMNLETERERLFHTLHFARSYSISKQVHVIACPSHSGLDCDAQSNWYAGWIVFVDNDGNRKMDGAEELLIHENPMMKNILATASINRQKIRFNTMGFSPGTNLSINFCDDRGADSALSIIINNAGRIKQSKPISNNICSE